MSVELIIRLEELVERLLNERAELLCNNRELVGERDRLRVDRRRIHAELGELLTKLDRLEGRGA